MRQFDVLDNPIPRARAAMPFVAILQSDLADTGRERVVAPLASNAAMPTLAARLIPMVKVANQDYAFLVLPLTTLPTTDRRHVVGNHTVAREQILAAVVIDPRARTASRGEAHLSLTRTALIKWAPDPGSSWDFLFPWRAAV